MSAAADLRVVGSPASSGSAAANALPNLKTDVVGLNDTTLFAVYCFIKNFIG